MIVQERYSPVVVGVNSTVSSYDGVSVAGFLAVTAGTISLSNQSVLAGVSVSQTLFAGMPVVAGCYYPIPFRTQGGYVFTTAGGASGVLGVV